MGDQRLDCSVKMVLRASPSVYVVLISKVTLEIIWMVQALTLLLGFFVALPRKVSVLL